MERSEPGGFSGSVLGWHCLTCHTPRGQHEKDIHMCVKIPVLIVA